MREEYIYLAFHRFGNRVEKRIKKKIKNVSMVVVVIKSSSSPLRRIATSIDANDVENAGWIYRWQLNLFLFI